MSDTLIPVSDAVLCVVQCQHKRYALEPAACNASSICVLLPVCRLHVIYMCTNVNTQHWHMAGILQVCLTLRKYAVYAWALGTFSGKTSELLGRYLQRCSV